MICKIKYIFLLLLTLVVPLSGCAVKSSEQYISKMSLSDKIYQMMMVTPESLTGVGQAVAAGDATKEALKKMPVGGIIYFAQNFTSREQTIEMINNTQKFSKIPLFIAVDEEGGEVSRLGGNADMGITHFPPMREVADGENALVTVSEIGGVLGRELKELGFNVDFAPVADVLVDVNNTEIGNRSFGTEPQAVAALVSTFTSSMENEGVSSVLKHFPGHGSTVSDSHKGYSQSVRTLEELRCTEFVPFKAGIDAGADFVLVSHMSLPRITDDTVPASLSDYVITNLLRGELGYDGIVITDALNMGAITEEFSCGEAAVAAIKAGVDILLMPQDIAEAHDAVLNAVERGDISESQIDESVGRIISVKKDKNLF